jgi:4-oxalmesaconate hydratase
MIIDCHGHYTTFPPQLTAYREAQRAALAADPDHVGEKGVVDISDDEIRERLEPAQIRLQRERGTDLTLFSPRASWMAHHEGNPHTSRFWSEHCNELVSRVCNLYPDSFAPVCQLPQSPGAAIEPSVAELTRCVEELGFVGCNLNPDPSGGLWSAPNIADRYWYPLYERMVELDVPAMVHVSASCNPNLHTLSSHYLGADTTIFVQLMMSDLFERFPTLRLIIPHGGGAVPYHWGRFRGLAQDLGLPPLEKTVLGNVFFDTCVYHQPGIDLLLDVIPTENVLFGSEMYGAVRGIDPETGFHFDDTRRYLEAAPISDTDRIAIFEHNVKRVFPRVAGSLPVLAGDSVTEDVDIIVDDI